MGKATFIVITFMLLSCSGGGGGSDVQSDCASQLAHMGFYWVSSGSFGRLSSEVADYTNFANVYGYDYIQDAIDNGLKVVYGVPNEYFFTPANWDEFHLKIAPYIDHIQALYLFDEPFAFSGYSVAQQNTIIHKFKLLYPNIPVWATIHFQSIGRELADYDVVSFTPNYGKWNIRQFKTALARLKETLKPWQKLVFTVDSYEHGSVPDDIRQEYKADFIRDVVDIALCEPLCIGLFIFIYPDISTGTGSQGMPIVEDELRSIYHELF